MYIFDITPNMYSYFRNVLPLAVRRMTICGKMVGYKSGHKQFDVASAISVWNSQEGRVREHFDLFTATLYN